MKRSASKESKASLLAVSAAVLTASSTNRRSHAKNMDKQFLIQVGTDERTRMQCNDGELRTHLEIYLNSFFTLWTAGSMPNVRVLDISGLDLALTAAER